MPLPTSRLPISSGSFFLSLSLATEVPTTKINRKARVNRRAMKPPDQATIYAPRIHTVARKAGEFTACFQTLRKDRRLSAGRGMYAYLARNPDIRSHRPAVFRSADRLSTSAAEALPG